MLRLPCTRRPRRRELCLCFLIGLMTATLWVPRDLAAQSRSGTDQIKRRAQDKGPAGVEFAGPQKSAGEGKTKNSVTEDSSEKRGSFVVAPLPISSSAIGTGLVPIVGYIFLLDKNDLVSPPSLIGAAGLITNNGTRAFAVGADLYLKQNTYEITAAYAHGNLNYDLYGIGIAGGPELRLPLEQSGQVFLAEVSRRVAWKVFVGVRLWTGSSTVTTRPSTGDVAPVPPDLGLTTTLRSLGVIVNRDTRPNRFYPTAGTLVAFRGSFFAEALGSKYSYQSYELTFNKYGSISKNQILAYNLFLCSTAGTPPFYGNCIYGTNNELRGYTAGRYLERHTFATQMEYRLSLPKRLGMAGFGGIGEAIPDGSQPFRSNRFLPAIGGGPRFQMSTKYHLNVRADFARGRDSWTWSMGVGEAF